jgi:hypothetical protein
VTGSSARRRFGRGYGSRIFVTAPDVTGASLAIPSARGREVVRAAESFGMQKAQAAARVHEEREGSEGLAVTRIHSAYYRKSYRIVNRIISA